MRLEAFVTARREPEVADASPTPRPLPAHASHPLAEPASADGTVAADVDPDAVLYFVRTLHLGLLLHRGSGLPGPDATSWQDLVDRLVASFGAGPTPPPGGPA